LKEKHEGAEVGKTAMARISVCVLSGLAVAATLWTPLHLYQAGAWAKAEPAHGVNRTLKGDRLAVVPRTVRTTPYQAPREPVRPMPVRRELPPGCEPSFSPIATPAMAHIAGRCIG
jgi:hypothetical protein